MSDEEQFGSYRDSAKGLVNLLIGEREEELVWLRSLKEDLDWKRLRPETEKMLWKLLANYRRI